MVIGALEIYVRRDRINKIRTQVLPHRSIRPITSANYLGTSLILTLEKLAMHVYTCASKAILEHSTCEVQKLLDWNMLNGMHALPRL